MRSSSERLSVRYLGEENGRRYLAGVDPGLVLRVEPGELRAWDYVDEVRAGSEAAARLIPWVVTGRTD